MSNNIYGRRKRVIVPYSKMGIKILSEAQMQNIFPTYDTLLDRIEAHRKGLSYIDGNSIKSDIQYNLMFDNVYSIMGKRGAGKTSVVFSLKEILKDRSRGYDIVLPIIMPEMIPKGCTLIGWILSLLEDTVKDLDNYSHEYSTDQFNGCMKKSSKKGLIDIYEKTKNLYYAQYYNVDRTDSFIDAVINTNKMTQNSYNFSKTLILFWDALISAVKEAHEQEDSTEPKEPLIHIIFDDVDLVPEAAIDLFSTMIKYLSHPNIVVYVTADEELIFDVIENNMTKRLEKVEDLVMYNHVIGGLKRAYDDEDSEDLESFNVDINKIRKKMLIKEELIHETPKRYGEKVLPPSCRYYLETFESIDKKKNFVIDWYNDDTRQDEMYSINQFLTKEIERYIDCVGLSSDDNFVQKKNSDDKSDFITAYLLFWGSTSRQLTNEVYILREFVNRLIKLHGNNSTSADDGRNKEHYCRRIYQAVKDFAYTTLIVSGNVRMRSDEIQDRLNELLIYDEQNGGVYIDYLSLREMAESACDFLQDRKRESVLREYISLFVLLYFIENFLKLENSVNGIEESKERNKVHGMGLLVDVLDYYVSGEYSLVCKRIFDDVPAFLWYYGKLLDQPHTLLNFDLNDPRTVRDYFSSLPKYTINKKIEEIYRTSPVWMNTITQILYFANERIYNITRKECDFIRFNREDSYFYDLYYTQQQHNILDEMTETLSNLDSTSIVMKYRNIYKDIYVNKKKEYTFSVDYIVGETLGELDKRMRGTMTPESFQENCASYAAMNSEQKFSGKFGTAECSDILFKELLSVREKIMEVFYKFRFHRVNNVDDVERGLSTIAVKSDLNLVNLTDAPKGVPGMPTYFISSKNLIRLFNHIMNSKEINQLRYRYRGEHDFYEVWEGVRQTVLNNCAAAITTLEEFEAAKKAIILFHYYALTQNLYILSFQKQSLDTEYHYIDKNMIPYKEFYENIEGIKDRMKKNDYLGLTLRQGIREKVDYYIHRFTKGSD